MSEATSATADTEARSRRRLVVPIVLGVLAVVAAGGFLVLRKHPGSPAASQPATSQGPRRSVAGGPAGLTQVYSGPSITFADASHGFMLLKLCPAGGAVCDAWLASTA